MLSNGDILVVDDEPLMLQSIRVMLSAQGYDVMTAGCGADAADCLGQGAVDLVLLDIMLPDMDGYELMGRITETYPDIPVIVITGHASTESAIAALRQGAYDYLRKPFEYEELLKTVGNAVAHVRLKREHRLAEEALLKAHSLLEQRVRERTAELARANEQLVEEIATRKQAEEDLRRTSEKIKLLTYSISHDLKSPIIGIHGLTRLLHTRYRDLLEASGQNLCDQILRTSEQASALIEKLNVYISAKETPLAVETFQLKDAMAFIKEEFLHALNTRMIAWVEPPESCEITADRIAVFRILRNLVDNALKYGGPSLTKITFGYKQSNESQVLSVSDDGAGLRKKDPDKIFERFVRGATSQDVEGCGLGLAIVKEIAEQHGGRAWVETNRGGGVTFYVALLKKPVPYLS
jgi:signal transduction histidine kinase